MLTCPRELISSRSSSSRPRRSPTAAGPSNNRRTRAVQSLAVLLAACALLGVACRQEAASGQYGPRDLVIVQQGTIPIIITAPHGGTSLVPGVEDERASRAAVKVRDVATDEVALALADRVEELVGGRPYAVIAGFHRKYIDANRAESVAFEDSDARPYYLAYHQSIRDFVDLVRKAHPAGAILIDVHGQSKPGYEKVVCRGTRDGKTVGRLTGRHGLNALIGPHSIFARLEASGYEVFPPNEPPHSGQEGPCYDGGHTVVAYGSHNVQGIDAIQVEIGWDLASGKTDRSRLTAALAEAIAAFYEKHLSPVSRPPSKVLTAGD